MLNNGYFSDMGLADWIGIALFAPLMMALLLLLGYIIVGIIGSGPRRRRIADANTQKQPVEEATLKASRRKVQES